MPSLSALGEFKDSFDNIANEREELISRDIPFESLKLPGSEAAANTVSRAALLASDNSAGESPPESAREETDAGVGAFDFSAFLGTLPTDVSPPPLDEPPSVDEAYAGLSDAPSVDDAFAGIEFPETPVFEEEQTEAEAEDQSAAPEDSFANMDFGETPEAPSGEDDILAGLGLSADAGEDAGVSGADAGIDFGDALGDATGADLDLPSDAGADLDLPADMGIDFGTPDDTTGADLDLSADIGGEAPSDDSFAVPDGLLSGLSEEIESAPADFADDLPQTDDSAIEESPDDALNMDGLFGEAAAEDVGGEDSGALPDFDLSDTGQADAEPVDAEMPSFEDFDDALDLGGERRDGSFSAESSDVGLGGESSEEPAAENAASDLNLDDFAGAGDASPPTDEGFSFGDIDLGGGEDGAEPPPADEGFSFGDIDLGGDSSDSGADASSADDSAAIDFGEESIDLGGEDANGNLKLDDVLPESESGADFTGGFDSGDSDMSFDSGGIDLPDFDTDSGPDAQDRAGLDIDNLNVEVEDSGASMDFGDLGGDFASESIDIDTDSGDIGDSGDTGAQAVEPLGPIDFELPGIEDMFDKSKIETMIPPPPKPKKSLFKRKKAEIEAAPEPDDVDEIRLSQEDLNRLLATLSSFPLNLRVACEELIAEQVLEPQQLSKLLRYLINGVSAKETAEFASQLLKKQIIIPRSFEKSSGAALEAEKASFAYIFVHNFLPILRLFVVVAALLMSAGYLVYNFIYLPLQAESLYKRGYERIFAGEYTRANELFHEASNINRKKKWFYKYAEGFRDERRYLLAEAKYDELLRYYPRDKKGVLDYSYLETYYLLNYDKANRILQRELLDYAPDDYDGLLASGDNFLAWADSNPEEFYDKYDDARFAYARLLEKYGWKGPLVERMMRYFIRTDNLKEVLPLRYWFDGSKDRKLSSESLAELGGYLLDKQISLAKGEIKGVPDPYIESIESVRAMLLQAVSENPELPEPHYHLARYYNIHGNSYEERLTLENAVRAFDLAKTETVRRRKYRVDTHFRYANLLINLEETFLAEEQVVRGIELYEDFLSRNLLPSSSQLGQLYSLRGDLDYFIKAVRTGDRQYVESALDYYRRAEQHKWSPPEIQYRIGSAYYQLEDWKNALDYLFKASASLPLNRRLLYALGNTAYRRGNYYAAQGYYDRLLDVLETQRVRLPVLLPNDGPEFLELGERLMMARNNAGVVYEALAEQTGRRDYRSKALGLYTESARAWDSITRNPRSMERRRIIELPGAPSVNPGFSNANNAMKPVSSYEPQIFPRIDKDVLEPSKWEEIAPYGGLQN